MLNWSIFILKSYLLLWNVGAVPQIGASLDVNITASISPTSPALIQACFYICCLTLHEKMTQCFVP